MKKTIVLLVLGLLGCTAMRAQEDNEIDNPECDFVYQDIGYHITDSVKRTVEIVYLQTPGIITSASMQGNNSLKNGLLQARKTNFNNRDVTIPEEVESKGEKYTVTGIAENGFTTPSYDHIDVLTLPSTLRYIGAGAFSCNDRIRKIVFTSKETVHMKGGWIVWYAAVDELELSDGFEILGGKTFGANICITKVKIGAGLYFIGNNCFADLIGLEKFELSPDNPYLSLHEGVLFNHDKTKLMAAPIALTGTFEIPEGVIEVDSSAFCSSHFSNITFPSSLKKIGANAFQYNKNSCVNLPEGLEEIGSYAFAYAKFKEVTIPSTIKVIEEYAFFDCSALKTVRCRRTEPLPIADDSFWTIDFENCVLYVPVGCVEAYRNAGGWTEFKHIEEETAGVDGIATDANAVQSVKYVNIAGMESDKPFAGLNIVVTTRADGSRHATKQQF